MRRGVWAIIALLLGLAAGTAAGKAEPAAAVRKVAEAKSAAPDIKPKAMPAGRAVGAASEAKDQAAEQRAKAAAKAAPAGVSYACLAIAQGRPADEVLAPASGRNLASFYYTKDAQGYLWRLASVNLSADEDNPNIRLIEFRVVSATQKPGIAQFKLEDGALALATNKDGNIYLTLTLPDIAIKYRCITN